MRMLRRTTSFLAIGAAVLLSPLAAAVGPAQPASAASPCDSTSTVTHGSFAFEMPTLGHNTGNINCFLAQGDVSSAVRTLQSHLNVCYWTGSGTRGHIGVFGTRLSEDGQFGMKTKAALQAVQNFYSIKADGGYGPQTRSTINFFADDGNVGRCVKFGA